MTQAWAVLLETGAHANDQTCMVVAADTAAVRESALCQQPLACLTCMSTVGAFVSKARRTHHSLSSPCVCACYVYQQPGDMNCPSCPTSTFKMGQILGLSKNERQSLSERSISQYCHISLPTSHLAAIGSKFREQHTSNWGQVQGTAHQQSLVMSRNQSPQTKIAQQQPVIAQQQAHLYSTSCRVAHSQDGVHQQYMPLCNIPWQLFIYELLLHYCVTHLACASTLAGHVPICQLVLRSLLMPACYTAVSALMAHMQTSVLMQI